MSRQQELTAQWSVSSGKVVWVDSIPDPGRGNPFWGIYPLFSGGFFGKRVVNNEVVL